MRPQDFQARLILGNAYLYQNKIGEATDTFKSLIATAPDNPVGYYRLGVLQRMLRQYDAAMDNFEKAISSNPKLIDVFTNIIGVQAAKKEYSQALKRCDRQLKQYADSPALAAVVYNLKGGLYRGQGKKTAAIESFRTAIWQNPNFLRPYYALAEIYLAEHQEEKAIARYKGLLEVNPKEAQAHMLLGIIYETQNRYDLSEKHYRAALEVNSEFAAAANNLAFMLADQDKDIDEALRLARLAKEKLPNSPYVMDTLGWAYYKKGLYGSAIGEFSDSLEKNPENPVVMSHLGMAYYKNGDAQKARVELEKALGLAENFNGVEEARQVLAGL
jgi:tetratricopeptide (TPR) repeat protein